MKFRWKNALGVAAKAVFAAKKLDPSAERPLSPREKTLLDTVYRGTIDFAPVVVKGPVGPVLGVSRRAFVIENTVFLPREFLPLAEGVLVHELCHVWQFQHGGHAYIGDSLHAQFLGDGYRLEKGIAEGKRWAQLNREQQATLLEEAWVQGCFSGGRLILRGRDQTPYLEQALVEVRAGRGASFE